MAATTGMGRLATSLTLARNPATKGPVSSLVILALSFKSAPTEQKCIVNIGTAWLFSRKKTVVYAITSNFVSIMKSIIIKLYAFKSYQIWQKYDFTCTEYTFDQAS